MTLEKILCQKLASWRPPGGRHELTVSDEGSAWTVTVTADRCDEVGCLLWEMSLASAAARGLDLQTWAQRVVARVTGLLEPLKIVEIDLVHNQSLLRSTTPSRRGDMLHYYEVLLHGTSRAEVRRYQGKPSATGPREQLAFALTHEVLVKLVTDLAADA
jgi:hypothetical protein